MFCFPRFKESLFLFSFKVSVTYSNLVKYIFTTKGEAFIFSIADPSRILKLLLNILIFHDNTCICISSMKICSPCGRSPNAPSPRFLWFTADRKGYTSFCKSLMKSIENNHTLVGQSSTRHSWEMKASDVIICSLEISSIRKDISKEVSKKSCFFNPVGKVPIRYC